MAIGTATALLASAAIGGGASLAAARKDSKSQSKAIESAEAQKAASQEFIERQIKQARSDIFKLFPAAQGARKQGLDAGLHLYKQAYPAMMNTFQQGNVGAQNMLLQGLPQMQNALLGKPVNLQGLQAQTLQQPQGLTLPQYQQPQINDLGLGNA
jgi:hypothetical protein